MKRLIAAGAVALAVVAVAACGEAPPPARSPQVDAAQARMMAQAAAPATPQPTPEPQGGWETFDKVDDFNGIRNMGAQILGENRNLALVIRCRNLTLSAYFGTGKHLLAYDDRLPVEILIDGSPFKGPTWDVSANNEAVFATSQMQARRITEALIGATVLRVRITEDGGERHEDSFQVSAPDALLQNVLDTCNSS